ncbi:MAG: 2-dehydropantoate 2-reductase [Granulosicoccus sp.]|nr:2-dehydropantoate 2-reductase [Granulosicoccus sp.]
MKITIFGSGGLGGYYGARFVQSGHDVSFIARGEHLDALQKDGLRVYSPQGDLHLPAVKATDDPSTLGTQDVVIVSVKTSQLPDAALAMAPLVDDNSLVVPFLNGVEAPDVLADVLGSQSVVGGLSRIFSKIEAPGVVRHFNDSAYVEFGELDGRKGSARCQQLLQAFREAGVEAELSENIRLNLWRKLILVSAWGGLGALCRSSMGELRKHPETRQLISSCATEAIAVANAEGFIFPDSLLDSHWRFYDDLPDGATTSLSRDLLANKPSELEAWHGVIVRLADQHGIEVPTQRFVYHALLPSERRLAAD